jgi:hypothetical protein
MKYYTVPVKEKNEGRKFLALVFLHRNRNVCKYNMGACGSIVD